MKITKQDALDIEQTITWLWEVSEYIENNPPETNGKSDWIKTALTALDVSEEWLRRIQDERIYI